MRHWLMTVAILLSNVQCRIPSSLHTRWKVGATQLLSELTDSLYKAKYTNYATLHLL